MEVEARSPLARQEPPLPLWRSTPPATSLSRLGSTIMKITPGGSKSTFVSGDFEEYALAFDEQGNLFAGVEDASSASEPAIVKFTPAGTKQPLPLALWLRTRSPLNPSRKNCATSAPAAWFKEVKMF